LDRTIEKAEPAETNLTKPIPGRLPGPFLGAYPMGSGALSSDEPGTPLTMDGSPNRPAPRGLKASRGWPLARPQAPKACECGGAETRESNSRVGGLSASIKDAGSHRKPLKRKV